MAYYYITKNKDIWKSCGARKVKKIWSSYRPRKLMEGWTVQQKPDIIAPGVDKRLPKILIPMIRRTFPELITAEIVGVQPMSGPVGRAFTLRRKYKAPKIYKTRNTIPLWQFKKKYTVTFESKYWATVMFELDCMG